MQTREFDLVVIGSGPAGQKAAICASKLGKRAAIVDKKFAMGGVCVHTGTIPSILCEKQCSISAGSGSACSTAATTC